MHQITLINDHKSVAFRDLRDGEAFEHNNDIFIKQIVLCRGVTVCNCFRLKDGTHHEIMPETPVRRVKLTITADYNVDTVT